MSKQNTIIIIGILLVLAIFIFPKLGMFAIYSNTLKFSYSVSDFGTGRNVYMYDSPEKNTDISCDILAYPNTPLGWTCYNRGYFDYGVEVNYDCWKDNTCGAPDLYLDMAPTSLSTMDGTTLYGERKLNVYYLDRAKNSRVFYKVNGDISCDINGCNGIEIPSSDSDPSGVGTRVRLFVLDLSSWENKRVSTISFAVHDHPDDSKCDYSQPCWGGGIIKINTIIDVSTAVCSENEIKQTDNKYFICKKNNWIEVINFITLSEQEQQRLLDLIAQLEATSEVKAQIIQNLTSTLEEQIVMIDNLEILIEEKAQIIAHLKLNIEEQSQLISEMKINVAEQAIIINNLNLTIQQQAQLIKQMETNLALKAALIQQLQIKNENQAKLIEEMELSFADQAEIIANLKNLIGDDADIILELYDTVDDQAKLISELNLSNKELAQLVKAMDLSIQEDIELINSLKLTIEQEVEIIANLELSLEQEKDLVSQLRRTIEEQNKIIEDLKKQPSPTPFDLGEIWENYQIWIIIGGGILLLLLLMGGKKRR